MVFGASTEFRANMTTTYLMMTWYLLNSSIDINKKASPSIDGICLEVSKRSVVKSLLSCKRCQCAFTVSGKVAEKLRQHPWSIKLPKGASSDDILCLDRRGKGQLVFARESSLAPQSALYVDL